ncbi:MAG TPA: endopeptidase La, partial [Phaeodactylibacter sp.]|nr:endopeptidase La [Phaeodactylibacter sp.]
MNFLKDLFFLEGDEFSGEGGIASIFSMEQEDETAEGEKYPKQLPILVVRNTVLFPGVIIPINVGRPRSLEAIQKAYQMEGRYVAVLAQTESSIERPELDDIYRVGTIARILKIIHLPDGSSTAVLQGRRRFRLVELTKEIPYLEGKIVPLPHEKVKNKVMLKAIVSSILDEMAEIVELSPHIPPEAMAMLQNITNHRFLLNFLASNFVDVKVAEKQALLEMNELEAKAKKILEALRNQLQVLEIKDQIESKVRSDIEKQQRDYFLNQQLKTIQEELGQDPQAEAVQRLRERAEKKDWPEYVA